MLEIDMSRAEKVIGLFIKSNINEAGFKGSVLGLSGGLDSAVVAGLTAKYLGPEKVLGVLMPHRNSSQESFDHGMMVANHFGIKTKTVDISEMADGYHDEMDRLRFGNLLARLRMCVLFDQSKAHGLMVLGTSNKTELLLGYSTWYGDSAAGCYPIGDLYKTQVRALARHIGVPQPIIDKPPTADLWPGQTDEGEIGNTYERLDKILFQLFDIGIDPDEVAGKEFAPEEVEKVIYTVKRNQFKRVMPPICKLSNRTIDLDFRYIRDWSSS